MIRLAVYSRDDTVHRGISRAAGGQVSVELRLRSVAELQSTAGLDVLVIDEEHSDRVDELVDFASPLPIVLVAAERHPPASRRKWQEQLDGWAEISGARPEQIVAAACIAGYGMIATDPRAGDTRAPDRRGERTDSTTGPEIDMLTPRELDVLQLVARGMSNTEIASALDVSANTVKYHLSSLFAKLDAGNRSEATWHAIRKGLVSI